MSSTAFFEPPAYNLDGRQSLWLDVCCQSHDTWCGCSHPTAHLLSCLLPPGHPDRNLTVQQLIEKAYSTKWPSGGTEEEGTTTHTERHGEEEDTNPEELENVFGDAAIEELLTAAAADTAPR